MPWQLGRVCHRLTGNSDICRLPLKCRRKLHHCWHHMGKTEGESEKATILFGTFWVHSHISQNEERCAAAIGAAHNLRALHLLQAHAGLQQMQQMCLGLLVVTAKCSGVREGAGKLQRHLNLFWVLCLLTLYLGMLRELSPLSAARALIYNNVEKQTSRLVPVGLHTMENVFNYQKLKSRRICLD